MAMNETPRYPAQHLRPHHRGHPGTQRTRQPVVGQRGDQNAQNDGPGLSETRGQHQRQQLGLVAHLGQGDDGGRNKKGFHGEGLSNPAGWVVNALTARQLRPMDRHAVNGLAQLIASRMRHRL
jgi:hypothetical protein